MVLRAATLLVVLVLFSASQANASDNEKKDEFSTLMLHHYAQGNFHGGILYADAARKAHVLTLGLANYQMQSTLTTSQRFTINSMGKMFTAVLIMQLVEEGKIHLQDSLATLLPNYHHPRAREITLHQLLSHRSGLPDYFLMQLAGKIAFNLSEQSLLDSVLPLPLDFAPDTAFQYSNTGYLLLGQIILHNRTGSFNQILHKYIFDPLGMKDSEHLVDFLSAPRVPQYLMQDGKINNKVADVLIGDGGEISSLQDMYLFMSSINTPTLLSENSWKVMLTPHSLPSEVPEGAWPPPHQDPYGYGFGLMTIDVEGKKYVLAGHGGAGYGSDYAGRILGSDKVIILYNTIFKNPVLRDVLEWVAVN